MPIGIIPSCEQLIFFASHGGLNPQSLDKCVEVGGKEFFFMSLPLYGSH